MQWVLTVCIQIHQEITTCSGYQTLEKNTAENNALWLSALKETPQHAKHIRWFIEYANTTGSNNTAVGYNANAKHNC